MNAFLKIGLPWAISLGLVFYLGLHLGSKHGNSSNGIRYEQPNREPANMQINDHNSIRQATQESGQKYFKPPAMPPNLQRILQGGDIVERLGSYLDAVRSMDSTNIKQVIQAFEELPKGYGRHLEMKLLMRSWANFDPKGALAYASSSLDANSERRFGISEALAGWAVKDTKASIAWAEANHPDNDKANNPLLVGIIKGLMETDLQAANRLFLSLPSGSARSQSSSILAERFAGEGPTAAIQWAEHFPKEDPKMREKILGQIGAKLSKQDLERTANWVKSMPLEPGTYRILDNVIDQWISRDPAKVASWTGQLPDDERKKHAFTELTGKWARIDPVATAKWLNNLPSSTLLDPAVATFANRIKEKDPEGAIEWAQSITDPKLRDQMVQNAINTWEQTNPEKAKLWRENNAR